MNLDLANSLTAPRVVHFSPFHDLAGANRSCLTLLAEQSRHGRTFLVALYEGAFSAEARKLGVAVRTVLPDAHARLSRWERWKRTVGVLRDAIRDWEASILHCHSARGNRFAWPAIVGSRVKLLTHQRDTYRRDRFHVGLGRAHHIIAISKWVAANLPPRMQQKTSVVYNAVMPPGIERIPRGPRAGPLSVGMAGRCKADKGFDLFIEALKLIDRNVQFEAQLWGVDSLDHSDDYTRRICAMVEDLPPDLRTRVHVQPFRPDIESFYAAVDVVVVPSRFPEPFGRVAIEAMAWQRAVIAANHGGLPEIVTQGKTGVLFPPGDVRGLAEQISLVLRDPELRSRLAATGRADVEARFLPAQHAGAVDEVYRRLLRPN